MSHTMCTRSNAWPERGTEPPFPTSQNPNFAICALAHAASLHPHQYVTPSTLQTGSVRKHFTGHDDGAAPLHKFFPSPATWDGNPRTAEATSSDVAAGKTQRATTAIKTTEKWEVLVIPAMVGERRASWKARRRDWSWKLKIENLKS